VPAGSRISYVQVRASSESQHVRRFAGDQWTIDDRPAARLSHQRIAFLLEHLRALNEALAVAEAVKIREMDPAELAAAMAKCEEIEARERLQS